MRCWAQWAVSLLLGLRMFDPNTKIGARERENSLVESAQWRGGPSN